MELCIVVNATTLSYPYGKDSNQEIVTVYFVFYFYQQHQKHICLSGFHKKN